MARLIRRGWNSVAQISARTGQARTSVYRWAGEDRPGYPTLPLRECNGHLACKDEDLEAFCLEWGIDLQDADEAQREQPDSEREAS